MKFTHLDEQGRAKMVDVGRKDLISRKAIAEGKLFLSPQTGEVIRKAGLPKGNPFEVARLAGIQAAKLTSQLIPLCHNLNLDLVDVQIELQEEGFLIRSEVSCRGATGVEMEALTAASIAALTVYDMCKAMDKGMVIEKVCLVSKTGGKSGDWERDG